MSRSLAVRGEDARGELRLGVELRRNRSVVAEQYHRGGLRILRPLQLDPWQVTCVTVNPGGGYLGGDVYRMGVDVSSGAGLLLTSQSATKVYRTPATPARQESTYRVGDDALLEVLPDQLIVYRGGSYRQSSIVQVAPGATCIMADVITPGWAPDGTRFGYRGVVLRTEFHDPDDGILALDNLHLVPPELDPRGLGVLDGYSHAGSLLAFDRRVDALLCDEVHDLCTMHPDVRAAVTLGPAGLLVVRALGNSTHEVTALLSAVDDLLRERWFGLAAVNLRKY